LPKNLTHLTHLTLGNNFNKKVDNFPKNLAHLTLGNNFNQKVDNLPQNLIHITLGNVFNQKVDNLPQNLIHITLGNVFNQKVDNLPKNLKYLKLGWLFQNKIIIPKNIKELSLSCNNNLINNIPEHIENIYIYFPNNEVYIKKIENLPPTIKEIVIKNEEYKEYIKIPFGCIITII
jgi:hypothetical protein